MERSINIENIKLKCTVRLKSNSKKNAPTIIDVAEYCKLSKSTVAYILSNNSSYKSTEKTRKLVIESAKKLGYKPNHFAKALVTKKTFTIGIIFPFFYQPFYGELMMELQEKLEKEGYVGIFSFIKDYNEYCKSFRTMIERGVDGIITTSPQGDRKINIEDAKCPIVTFVKNNQKHAFVSVDHSKCFRELTEHLIKLGHHRIAFAGITGSAHNKVLSPNYSGYSNAMKAYNINIIKEFVYDGLGFFETGYDSIREFISLKKKPTALVAHNDIVALGAIRALHDFGLKVPDDFAVVGFDDIKEARYSVPSLTTVRQPVDIIALELVRNIIREIQGEPINENIIVGHEFVIRESCGFKVKQGYRT